MKRPSLGAQIAGYDRLVTRMRNGPCADCKKPGPNARFDFCADCWAKRVENTRAARAKNVTPRPLAIAAHPPTSDEGASS